jgi:hypothetical protein
LTNLGSESETCVGSRVHLVGVSISFEKNFYRLPFIPPLWFAVSVLHATRSRPCGPHGPPGWHDGCPLGRGPPRSRAKRPLGRGPPRSRAKRPLGRGSPRSRAQRPLGEDRLARGHLHARRPRSCPRLWTFDALKPQEHTTTLTSLGITPRRCSTDSRGRPSLQLCNTV